MFTKETMVFIPILIAAYLCLTPPGLTAPAAGRIARILRTLLPYGVVWVAYMAIRHQVIKPPSNARRIYSSNFHTQQSLDRALCDLVVYRGTWQCPGD